MKLLTTANYHADLQVNLKASHIIKYRDQEKDITINFLPNRLEFSYDINVPESICNKIILTSQYSSLPFHEARDKYAEILGGDRTFVAQTLQDSKKILSAIKEKLHFCLNNKNSDDILHEVAQFYTINNCNYRVYPDLALSANLDLSANLTSDVINHLEAYFVESKTPLLAFSILRNSEHQKNLRQRWIEITVAAELGIKEFFIRKFPNFEVLLNEMPSPNIRKMYGSLLEHYTGDKAPNLTAIQKGIELRNALIHSFSEKEINAAMLNKYSKEIKECLIYLQEKLTGTDTFTRNHITFGSLLPIGIYSDQIEMTDEQKILVLSGNYKGNFKVAIY